MSATTIIVNDDTPRRQYTATSGQTVFDFPIPFFEEEDLTVYLTPAGNDPDDAADLLTLTTDYTINGEGTQDGGEIVLTTGATAGDIITILRQVVIERVTDYQAAGDLLAETINREQDEFTMIAQQLNADHDHVISRRRTSTSTADLTLPEPQANYVFGWNSNADGIVNYQEIGNFIGTDQTTTTADYVVRDIVKEAVYGNLYICIQDSPTGTLLTNTSYWALIFDASPNNWYLGAQSSAPSVDNYGSAVIAGHWYFNTTDDVVYVYNGTAWQTSAVTPASVQQTAEEQAVSFAIALG